MKVKKQAICIQCHAHPELVNYIIEVFPEEFYDFFVHVDKKSTIIDQIEKKNNVTFVPRVDVRWGRFSQVEATLKLLDAVDGEHYQYVHLISGNCFPAMSPEEMYEKLKKDQTQYIEITDLMNGISTWSWQGKDRYLVKYPQWMIQRPANKPLRYFRIAYREFVMRTKVFQRKKLPAAHFYGGSSWFSVTGEAIEWMKGYLLSHPEYADFFKNGVCSDEVFFSTLMAMSPFLSMIANDAKRFMLWEGTNTGGPMELRESNARQICRSGDFWCRKVTDINVMRNIEREWCAHL